MKDIRMEVKMSEEKTTEEKKKFDDEEEKEQHLTFPQKLLRMFQRFGDLFFLNVYFTITCIPIITIGASITALFTVTNKMVQNEEGPIHQTYLRAFKENFKQATIIWLLDLLYIGSMVLEYIYCMGHTDQISKVLFIMVGFQFFLFALAFPLQFPLLSRYENSVGKIMLNSLIIAFARPSIWFRMFFIWALPFALYYVSIKALIYTWYLWGLIFTALFAYICSTFLIPFYEEMENPAEDDEEEISN